MSLSVNIKPKAIVGLILSIIIAILSFVVPPEAIGMEAVVSVRTLGVLLITVILLMTETFAIPVTCFICIGIMYLFGCVEKFGDTLSGFTNTTSFFVIVSYALSIAITKMPLGNRLLFFMMKLFGRSMKQVLLAFMLTIATLSAFISNVATAAIFVALCISFLEIYGDDEEAKKQAGKVFMVCIAIAATVGGMVTPAGSSLNLLGINLIEKYAEIRVTFVQWIIIGAPLGYLAVFCAWFIASKMFKLPELDRAILEDYRNKLRAESIPDKVSFKEAYTLCVVILMFALWIASSWFPFWDVTLVATIGCILMFIPGVEILTYKEYIKGVNWTPYIIISTMIMVGGKLVANGVTVWLCNLIFPESLSMAAPLAVGIVAAIIFVMMVIIPSAPAIINLLAAPLAALAVASGLPPVMLMIPLSLYAGCVIIFPFDTVPSITYAPGYYGMTDLPKVSIPLEVLMCIFAGIWVPISLGLVGLV